MNSRAPGPASKVPASVRSWLTGPRSDPSVKVRFWTEVEGLSPENSRVRAVRSKIGRQGWASSLLAGQFPDGHWTTPGTSARELYRPKYTATNWFSIVLADLGATRTDPRIERAATLLLDRWSEADGILSGHGGEVCYTGNAIRTLVRFGYLDHPVVQQSIDWIVREQKRDGGWNCFPSQKGTLDGWEGLAALAEIPEPERSEAVRDSIERGAEFYLKRNLMDEGHPGYAPWLRLHYPNHFFYDLLVGLRILTRLGYGSDRRLGKAERWLLSKRLRDGTWAIDATQPDWDPGEAARYGFPGPEFPLLLELPGLRSRWVTVEALSVLRRIEAARS